LESSDITNFTSTFIGLLNSTQIAALDSIDVIALKSDALSLITSTSFGLWTSAEVNTLTSTQLGGIKSDAVASLNSQAIVALTSNQIAGLNSASISTLGSAALVGITSLNLRGLTSGQIAGLSSAQVSIFNTTAYSASFNVLGANNSLTSTNIIALTSTQTGVTTYSFITPIVLDLNGDGIQTTTMQNGVTFDIDADGKVDKTAWAARGDGLLVRDVNKDGIINDGSELFGSATKLVDGTRAADGYKAMRAMDSNKDGLLTSMDAQFGELMVWVDKNGDGVSNAGEMFSLNDMGISSLSLESTKSTQMNNGNLLGLMGSFTTADGKTHTMGDVWFQTDAAGDKVFSLAEIAKAAGGSMSKVDMSSAKADTLNVSLADVLSVGQADILSGTSQVTITGDSGDLVHLTGGASWTLAGTQTEGADTYMVYVNANAHLLVNDKIHLIIS